MFLLIAAALAIPPVPAEVTLTADELETLADREVVLRQVSTDTGGVSVGIIDVNAPVSTTIDAVLDLNARVAETGALRSVEIYEQSAGPPETMAARYELRVMGSTIVFHPTYEIDRSAGWAVFTLDTSRDNDIVRADGSHHVYATDTGSRVVYTSDSDSGRSIPTFIKRWLANSALQDQLGGIRTRAEAG